LPDRFTGYDELCRAIVRNDLPDDASAFALCDRYWAGAAKWAKARGIDLESSEHFL
jgi:KNTase C-terminal domain